MSKFNKVNNLNLKIFLFILILLLILKANLNPFTYDEARTYLDYVRPKDFIKFSIANNHPINTILMIIFNHINSSSIILRLPNIFFGSCYFLASYIYSKNHKNNILIFFTLTLSPLLFEFFTLARGYGISASLLFLGTVIYFKFKEFKYILLVSSIFFTLSIYTIYLTSIYVFSFFAVISIFELKKRNYVNYIFSTLLVSISSFQVTKWMLGIISYDEYLYGLEVVNINYFFRTIFGFGPLLNPYNLIIGNILLFSLLVIWIFTLRERINTKDSFYLDLIFFLTILILYSLPLLLGTKIPQFRLLVPFLPILLLIISNSIKFLKSKYIIINNLISLFLLINFIVTFEIENTFDWRWNKVDPSEAIVFDIDENGYCSYPYIENPVAEYYRLQQIQNNEIYCDVLTGELKNKKN